jgi:hypothetical protein
MNRYACKTTMRGYALACSDLINNLDQHEIALKLLREAEITARDLHKMDLDAYDYQALIDVLRGTELAA